MAEKYFQNILSRLIRTKMCPATHLGPLLLASLIVMPEVTNNFKRAAFNASSPKLKKGKWKSFLGGKGFCAAIKLWVGRGSDH
jgi:hypothetical protein